MATVDIGTGETDTTLQGWEDRIDGVLSAPEIGQAKGEAFSLIDINGSTTSAENYIKLTAKPGFEHDGRAHEVSGAGNARIEYTGANECITIKDDFIEVSWMEVYGPGDNAEEVVLFQYLASATTQKFHHNILHNNHASESNIQAGIYCLDADPVYRIYRNIVYGMGATGIYAAGGAAGSALYQNTIYACNNNGGAFYAGIRCGDTDFAIKGNVCFDNGSKDFYDVTGVCDYNADSDGTETEGANTLNSLTATDELTAPTTTWADCDLTIKAGANLIGEGNDPLSGTYTDFPEINYPISDRDNAITGTWDIGADQYVSGGEEEEEEYDATMPILMSTFLQKQRRRHR